MYRRSLIGGRRLERALIDSLVRRYAPRWIAPLASY